MDERRPNRLIHEKSPYLLQHAHNPVDWYPWGEEAFSRARQEQKPILLSVGYSACHWCHVMERESFENEETAGVMNRLFVSIKVDREERPDVDQVYQHTVQMLTGQGGWPLTAFLTPTGEPFFAGTYFPPDERYGRPSFRRVLLALADAWQNKRGDIEQNVGQLMRGLAQINDLSGPGEPSVRIAEEAATALLGRMDPQRGGFRGAMKFPNCPNLAFLLGRSVRGGDAESREAVLYALRQMAAGGIYDQLGGGFHRYTVDDRWLVPHFEKMLYDNGQLLALCFDAWRLSGDERFAEVGRETAAYVLREMRADAGGFFATQDADSEGEEGKYFVWTPAQVEAVVGAERAAVLNRALGVTAEGNFERTGSSVLHRARPLEEVASELERDLADVARDFAEGRRALLAAREGRTKPARDDKVLTSWNGLMISALSRSPDAEHVAAAAEAARFVLDRLRPDGELCRSWCDGEVRHGAVLDDYAFFTEGLLRLYQATFDATWLAEALELADRMVARFWDGDARAFYLSGPEVDLIQRPRSTFDQAIPSGAGVAAMVLSRLGALSGRRAYLEIVDALLGNYAEAMRKNPFGFGTLLDVLDGHLRGAREVVVAAADDDPAAAALLEVVRQRFDPDLLVCRFDPARRTAGLEGLAELLEGKEMLEGRATAYVCQRQTCSAPVTEPGALAEILWR